MSHSIFTIGYGARSTDELIELLKQYQIDYLIDVRSKPYSRFKPEFCRDQLNYSLKEAGITYVFMGDKLGGQPDDPDCYVDGKVEYSICKQKPFFQQGLERLKTAWKKNIRVAVMCSEGKPQDCHRCKLIGESLVENGITVSHIDENGTIKSQEEVISILTGGQLLLLDSLNLTSRKKYAVPNGYGDIDDYP